AAAPPRAPGPPAPGPSCPAPAPGRHTDVPTPSGSELPTTPLPSVAGQIDSPSNTLGEAAAASNPGAPRPQPAGEKGRRRQVLLAAAAVLLLVGGAAVYKMSEKGRANGGGPSGGPPGGGGGPGPRAGAACLLPPG